MEFKDYYKILGVERNATAAELKRAYRKLARQYHPDVSKESDAEHRFKEMKEAYEVLKDPEKRGAYDQLGADWQSGQNFRPPPGAGPGVMATAAERAAPMPTFMMTRNSVTSLNPCSAVRAARGAALGLAAPSSARPGGT